MSEKQKLDWRTIDVNSDLNTAFNIAIEACNRPNSRDGVFSLEYKANYDFGEYGRAKDEVGDWYAEMRLSDFKYSVEAWGQSPQEALLKVTIKFLAAKEMRPVEINETVDAVDSLDIATLRDFVKREIKGNRSYSHERFNLFDEVRKASGLPKSIEVP